MVTKFLLPRVGRVEGIRTRTLGDYARMFLVVREWLGINGFPALRGYLGARVIEGGDPKRLLARKKFLKEFMDSAQYRELLGGYFSTSSQSIIDSGVVIDMISAVHVGSFESIPDLDEGETVSLVEYRIETVAQEVLRFIARIAQS